MPYGGLTIGRPWTARPRAAPACAGALAAVGAAGAVGRGGASAAQQSPGPSTSRNSWPPMPETYRISENPGGGATSERADGVFPACAKTVCSSGSYAEPGQLVAVPAPIAPRMPLTSPSTGGVNGDDPTL